MQVQYHFERSEESTTGGFADNAQGPFCGEQRLERHDFFMLLLVVNPTQLHNLLSQALEFVEDEKPLHAAQLLQRIIAAEPSCGRAYALLVEMYVQWGQHRAVENLLRRGLRHNRRDPELLRQLGLHYMRLDQYEKALSFLLKIRHVRDAGLHRTLGILYAFMGQHQHAVEELKLAAQLDPKLPKAFELWAKELLVLKKADDAIAILKKAIVAEPYSSLAHRLLGDAYMSKKQWQSAYDHYVLAADMDPDDTDAWLGIAQSLSNIGRLTEARRYCDHVLRVQPNNIQASVLHRRICARMRAQVTSHAAGGREYN